MASEKKIAELLKTSRYDPAILEQLEPYVTAQCTGGTYDLDANLAVLKLYQFHPEFNNVPVVVRILLKALITAVGNSLGGAETARLLQAIPVFPLAMVGGLIVQVALQRSRQTSLASASAQASVGSVAMDLLITAAMASLNLPLLEENWLPFIALAIAGLSWNIAAFFLLAPRIFSDHWFERGIADFGQGTGVTATGLLLLRMADPYGRSRVMEAFSFKQLVFEPFLGGGLITALSPLLIAGWGLPRFSLVALVLTLLSIGFGLRLGRRAQLS